MNNRNGVNMNYFNLIIHPVQFFKQLITKEKISLLIPAFILILIGILSGLIAGNAVSTINMGIAEDQMSMIKGITIGTGIFSGIIGLVLTVVIKAGIFNFILNKMGGAGKFKTAVYVVSLAYFPKIFQSILNLIFQHPINLTTTYKFDWVAFLGSIFSIFNIWQIFITIIGLSVVYGLSYKKTAIPVIGMEILSAGFTLGTSLVAANSMASLSNTSIK
ncbi:Yip1 family protein [Acetobacterium paludosum]|uniref:Yip1 family protein n=1 Tax=Acetobacterium paludosum TaxID=52693 RepID=UPI00164AF51E|nr:Yip1 family protein [Acetobacterium paludosum]